MVRLIEVSTGHASSEWAPMTKQSQLAFYSYKTSRHISMAGYNDLVLVSAIRY